MSCGQPSIVMKKNLEEDEKTGETKLAFQRRAVLLSQLSELRSLGDYLSFVKKLSLSEKIFLCLPENGCVLDVALMLCVREGKIKHVKQLLKMGANPNCVDSEGTSPLMWLTMVKPQEISSKINIARILVKEGGDLNQRDHIGLTPFLYAAGDGPLDLLKEYVALGADIYVVDIYGRNALMLAYLDHFWKGKEKYLLSIDFDKRFLRMTDAFGRSSHWYKETEVKHFICSIQGDKSSTNIKPRKGL